MSTSFQPISVPRLYRMIADQIKAKIDGGTYRPGERLPSERELADALDVSRPSVREALIALEVEGYVDVRVGTGVFVNAVPAAPPGAAAVVRAAAQAPVNDIGARDLLEARLLVEPCCAELAARNATPAQLRKMEEAVLALPASGQPTRHNDTFHLAIAEASGNAALASTLVHLWTLSENSSIVAKLNQHYVVDEVWNTAHSEHLALLYALQKRQPVAARNAMRDHLVAIRRRLGLDAAGERET